ncbi:hypothetical protein [Paenibacillus pedocola]|uniref:hypothetical protein n=1 Tax=Paenibacillus pedocola TaxID=3242193 RepID=UPI00287796EB|nr:hypothetical protein [Paenibacillus typhae]
MDFLLDVLYSFQVGEDKLYFEYGYSYIVEFPYKNIVNFEDAVRRIWFCPCDKEEAKSLVGFDFLHNCIVLKNDRDMGSCKYRLLVVESPESVELKVAEIEEGSFQELLKNSLQPYLEQGVRVLTEQVYIDMIEGYIAGGREDF